MSETIHEALGVISALGEMLVNQFLIVLRYPFEQTQRIFVLYLLSSLLFALFVFSQSAPRARSTNDSFMVAFFHFLFPKEIWRNSSAWLDVRYFFFHQMFRVFIYGAFMAAVGTMVFQNSSELLMTMGGQRPPVAPEFIWSIEILCVLFAVFANDLITYAIHFFQHKIPLLWEFHKVHHSATVMHPLTNYREHPIDNICYAIGSGVFLGLSGSVIFYFLGYIPRTPTIYSVGIFTFMYNFLAYNLRHSHVWLKWPGKWSYVFGSPAHHQIHHSCHPEHINKNFAFMCPIWDVLFGTFCLPNDNSQVVFGLGDGREMEYRSCLSLYFLPVKNLFSDLLPSSRGEALEMASREG